jgi:hypothetical protein
MRFARVYAWVAALLYCAFGPASYGAEPTGQSTVEPRATISNSRCVMENARVRRVLERDDGVWRTRSFARADGSNKVPVQSDEFLILLMDGTRLTVHDYQAQSEPVASKDGKGITVRIRYVPRGVLKPGAPRSIVAEYCLAGQPYLRKRLSLEMPKDGTVDRLEVERFRTRQACDLGGIGEPIFLGDSWFAGLEYPGSHTDHRDGLVTLAHYPGLAKVDSQGRWTIQSKTAVLGTGIVGDPVALAFGDYLESIRLPYPKHLLINTWGCSFRNPKSADDLLEFFDRYDKNLRPYGVKMDSVQPDLMGWEPKTLMHPRKDIFPKGYKPLEQALKARGARLSLWLALNGTGVLSGRFPDVAETAAWAAQQGFKRTTGPYQDFDGHFCLAVPKYEATVRETIRQTIADGDICHFKHDFLQGTCSAEGHGHLPTERHGFEAILDATLGIFAFERQLKPDIRCAPNAYVWLSPWWLMHANYLYYSTSDSGAVAVWPQLTNTESEMNYVDDYIYKVYRKWRYAVPMSAFVTQAFLRDFTPGVREDPLRQFADHAMMVCGRGLRLMDLYLEPSLPPEAWKALGRSLRWWQDHTDVLGSTTMVGGNPRIGEVYGYMHWKDDRGILCLRNPDVAEQTVHVPFDKSVLYRGPFGKPFRGRVVYPYVEDLAAQFASGQPLLLSVPGYTVMVIEFEPGEARDHAPAALADVIEGSGSASHGGRDWTKSPGIDADPSLSVTANLSVRIPDEAMTQCNLLLVARSNRPLPTFPSITVNGQPVKARVVSGSGDLPGQLSPDPNRETDGARWSIHCVDLQSLRGKTAQIVAQSSKAPNPFTLDAWVVADRPVAAAAAPEEHLPPTFWHNYRRQTACLLSYRIGTTPLHSGP